MSQQQPASRKRRAPAVFEDEDSENLDPINLSPSKKSKTFDGISKPSQFSLVTSPFKASPSMSTPPSVPSVRKALSSPKPSTTNSTPIALSRGSPKHKRVGLLSKRRASSSPFRRVDPPTFAHSSPGLPFSIDAALKGTIPDYTPKSTVATPTHVSSIEESMPKSWFFDIHEDTPEQEAANMMEHSAAILDISSDDDCETKKRNEELERGKENIPPPDFLPMQQNARAHASADAMETNELAAKEHVKLPRLRKIAQDAMDEDRSPLSDLPASDFYGEGLDATSCVTVGAGIDNPSGLSKEFDFTVPAPEEPVNKEIAEPAAEETQEKAPIEIFTDADADAEPQPEQATSTIPEEDLASTIPLPGSPLPLP